MKNLPDFVVIAIVLLMAGVAFSLFLPFVPIDETRYVSVAWEMKLGNSFIVPILHGLPYSHKPPFLFWLINLDWLLFGVNEITLRFIPLIFSVFNLLLLHKIALLLWDDKKIARYATLILSATLVYLIWSALIMFDLLLTFWTLVGILALLSAEKNGKISSGLLFSLAVGGGLLTKGPVIFVHILPVGLGVFWWSQNENLQHNAWYLKLFGAIIFGIALALLWVVPAAIMGGESYRQAILWGQSANRMVSSFAHSRPFWFYLPLLPVLFLPWVLMKPAWCRFQAIRDDSGGRFLLSWILPTLVIFSLISGKQIHYLVPMIPAVILLIAKNLAGKSEAIGNETRWHAPVALFYILLGAVMLFVPFIKLGSDVGKISAGMLIPVAIGIVVLGGFMLFVKIKSMDSLIKTVAVSSALVLVTLVFFSANTILQRYDMSGIAHVLKEKQDENYTLVHYGKYHGQYQFPGRLLKPLIIVRSKDALQGALQQHEKVLLVSYKKQADAYPADEVIFQQSFKNKTVYLLNEAGIVHFLK